MPKPSVSPETRRLIDAAIAEGRMRVFPTGCRSAPTEKHEKINAEQCGCGGVKDRALFLDELDGDVS